MLWWGTVWAVFLVRLRTWVYERVSKWLLHGSDSDKHSWAHLMSRYRMPIEAHTTRYWKHFGPGKLQKIHRARENLACCTEQTPQVVPVPRLHWYGRHHYMHPEWISLKRRRFSWLPCLQDVLLRVMYLAKASGAFMRPSSEHAGVQLGQVGWWCRWEGP